MPPTYDPLLIVEAARDHLELADIPAAFVQSDPDDSLSGCASAVAAAADLLRCFGVLPVVGAPARKSPGPVSEAPAGA